MLYASYIVIILAYFSHLLIAMKQILSSKNIFLLSFCMYFISSHFIQIAEASWVTSKFGLGLGKSKVAESSFFEGTDMKSISFFTLLGFNLGPVTLGGFGEYYSLSPEEKTVFQQSFLRGSGYGAGPGVSLDLLFVDVIAAKVMTAKFRSSSVSYSKPDALAMILSFKFFPMVRIGLGARKYMFQHSDSEEEPAKTSQLKWEDYFVSVSAQI